VDLIHEEVCEQETAHRSKCRCDLIAVKVGASPIPGDAGKLRNRCCRRRQAMLEKDQRRHHGPSGLEMSAELMVTGVAPVSLKPGLIA